MDGKLEMVIVRDASSQHNRSLNKVQNEMSWRFSIVLDSRAESSSSPGPCRF